MNSLNNDKEMRRDRVYTSLILKRLHHLTHKWHFTEISKGTCRLSTTCMSQWDPRQNPFAFNCRVESISNVVISGNSPLAAEKSVPTPITVRFISTLSTYVKSWQRQKPLFTMVLLDLCNHTTFISWSLIVTCLQTIKCSQMD